jgi:hypothetical protein
VNALLEHAGEFENPLIDYVMVNNGRIPDDLLEKYQRDGACMVDFNIEDYEQHPYKFIIDDFVEAKKNYLRHNADKVAATIFRLIAQRGFK